MVDMMFTNIPYFSKQLIEKQNQKNKSNKVNTDNIEMLLQRAQTVKLQISQLQQELLSIENQIKQFDDKDIRRE